MKRILGWLITALVAAGCLVPFSLVSRTRGRLAAERAALDESVQRLLAIRSENARLRAAPQPLNVSPDEIARARATLADLQHQIAETAHALEAQRGSAIRPFGIGSIVAAADWRNVGNATPEAALETALWAGAGGDVEALGRLLQLDRPARDMAERALAELPPVDRQKYATAEGLVAALTVPDVPLGAVQVATWDLRDRTPDRRWVQLEAYAGPDPKQIGLTLERNDRGWNFVVSEDVVARLLAKLRTGD